MKKNKKKFKRIKIVAPVSLREDKIVELAFKAGEKEMARRFRSALANAKIISDVLFPENNENDF